MLDFKQDEIKNKLVEFYERLHDQKEQIENNKKVNNMLIDLLQTSEEPLLKQLAQQLQNDNAKFDPQLKIAEARLACADEIMKTLTDEEILKFIYYFMIFVGIEQVTFKEEDNKA